MLCSTMYSTTTYLLRLLKYVSRRVQKAKCSNHAVKCYRSGLKNLPKVNQSFKGKTIFHLVRVSSAVYTDGDRMVNG